MASDQIPGLIVAGSEPKQLQALAGSVTNEPERFGVDFLWRTDHDNALWGIQRKELDDFFRSLGDNRLGLEFQQGQRLDFPILLLEGRPTWTNDGLLMKGYGRDITRGEFNNLFLSIMFKLRWRVLYSENLADTERVIRATHSWSQSSEPSSLIRRSKEKSVWGSSNAFDFQVWLLQSIPGVGLKTATDIVHHLGGSPFKLRVDPEELLSISGVGKKTVQAITTAVAGRPTGRKKFKKHG